MVSNKPVEKKTQPETKPTTATATQTPVKPSESSEKKVNTKQTEKEPEKQLDWKKHVKEFDLQEEATVNGNLESISDLKIVFSDGCF